MPTNYFSGYDNMPVMAEVATGGREIAPNLVPEISGNSGELLAVNGSSAGWTEDEFVNVDVHVPYNMIGGKLYRTVVMPDGKEWLAENLDFAWDGLSVPTSGAIGRIYPQAMYYQYDESTYGWNGRKCGLLYNWYAVKYLEDNKSTLIPGWHVPSNAEWDALVTAVGGADTAGTKLKAAGVSWGSHWDGTDDYGFAILPAGGYDGSEYDSHFYYMSISAYFWTTTEIFTGLANNKLFQQSERVVTSDGYEAHQYSVRLVRDAT